MITDILIPILSAVLAALVAYHTASLAIRSEEQRGRALILSYCDRFFIAFKNSFDDQWELRQDSLCKQQYINELDALLSELTAVSQNPFYVRLLEQEPEFSQVIVQARRELTEHNSTSGFALNTGTARGFIKLYSASVSRNRQCAYRKRMSSLVSEIKTRIA